jgi:hypothetical protein
MINHIGRKRTIGIWNAMLSFRSAGRFCPRGRSLLPSPLSGSIPHYSLLLTCPYPCLLLFSLLLSSKRTTMRGRSTMRSEARGLPRDRPSGDHRKARRLRPAVKGSQTHRARARRSTPTSLFMPDPNNCGLRRLLRIEILWAYIF